MTRQLKLVVRLICTLMLAPGLSCGHGHAADAPAAGGEPVRRAPRQIVISGAATAMEMLAANEIRRYVYLRTGTVLPVNQGLANGDCIVVTNANHLPGDLSAPPLKPQQFVLETTNNNGRTTWSVIGGDDVGTLYGAYRLVEKLGVRFGIDEDVVPDQPFDGNWPKVHESAAPRFALRGLQPFHDFSVGPDWWNLHDYQNILTQMAKLRLNFIGLHTYPSWNPSAGPEANVWIGLPEDVDSNGNVRFAYPAGVVTTERGWEVKKFPTGQYAGGGGLLFEGDGYGPDFLLDCLGWPDAGDAAAAMFNRYGDMQARAFGFGRRLGIKSCVGTEMPLGVAPSLAARLAALGMKADDPATIRRLYEGTFLRVMRKMPAVDYYGFCTPETWLDMKPGCRGWEMTTTANVERDFGLAAEALMAVHAPFGLATCGWRLGTRDDPMWTDRHSPKSWAISSINTRLGRDPVESHYGTIKDRPKWVIGWAEDDGTAGAHCCTCWDLQLWVERMFANSADAYRYGADGMMAIHWRTSAIGPNITALSRAGWDFTGDDGRPDKMPEMDEFWADWGRGMFAGDAGAEAGRLMQKLDGGHVAINALIEGGANTTDARIAEYFAPLTQLELLRPRINGAGNLERFDYWLNQVRVTRLRVVTWVLSDRLTRLIREADKLAGADKKLEFARATVVPLRVKLAESYQAMIAAYVSCAKSPGEAGTIASIESGSRSRVVTLHDAVIERMLGGPLPDEAVLKTTYHGTPRIFVSAKRTLIEAGKPGEIRAFVLADRKCNELNLRHRPMGDGAFAKIPATHRARQAYRVALPAQPGGTIEYYLEAVLDDGRKIRWPATSPAINQTAVVW